MPEDLIAGHLTPWRLWDRGGPRPVLALHCSLAHSGAWTGLAERLSAVTVTAPDLPGHGRAPDWDGRGDLHDLTTAMAAGLAQRIGDGGPVDILGHSFGATVALRLALDRPELVRSLVLIEPPLFAAAMDDPAAAPHLAAQIRVSELILQDPDAGAAAFHALWGSGEALADLPDRPRRYIVDRIHYITAQSAALVQDTAHLLRPGGLEGVGVPVLLVEGGNSPAVVGSIQPVLAARLPHATRRVLPGAGHMMPITHPDLLARAVQAHLDTA